MPLPWALLPAECDQVTDTFQSPVSGFFIRIANETRR